METLHRAGVTKMELAVVAGMILLLVALLLPAVYQSRDEARQLTSKNNLKQIGLAFLNYHEVEGSLPPGGIISEEGTAMQGWMVMLLPYIDDNLVYSWLDLNEPWQSPRNTFVCGSALPVYLNPGVDEIYTDSGFGLTHYQGNPNLLYRNSGVTFGQMENGTAHTWLTGEVAGNFQPWSYPFNWRPLGTKLCKGSNSYGLSEWNGGHLLFADGRVSFFSDQTSPEILKRFAAAPPIATEAQTTSPDRIFQTGNFHWEWQPIDLESDSESKHKYFVKMLENGDRKLLVINVFIAPKGAERRMIEGPAPRLLLRIKATTDVITALEETSMSQDSTSDQLAANVKTLQAFQKRLLKKDSAK